MRTTLWRIHLGGGCLLALAYVYLPLPVLRVGSLIALCLATITATLASVRLWKPTRKLPFQLFAAGEAVGFVAGSLGSSAAITRAGGSVIDATVISIGLGMLAWVFLASPYSVDASLPRSSGSCRCCMSSSTCWCWPWSSGWRSAAGTAAGPMC